MAVVVGVVGVVDAVVVVVVVVGLFSFGQLLGYHHCLSSSLLVMLKQSPEHFINYKVVMLSLAAELPRLNWFSQTDKIK